MGFPGGTSGKEPACQCRKIRDAGLIPKSGRSPGGEHGNLLQYSCQENPMVGYSPQGHNESDMTELARTCIRFRVTTVIIVAIYSMT